MRRHLTRLITLGMLIATGWCRSQTQALDQSAFLILRAQATSIAADIAEKIRPRLVDSASVRVSVEARTNQMMVENVFLEILDKSGLKSSLGRTDITSAVVQVHVIDQSLSYAATNSGTFQRTIQTILEARFQLPAISDTTYLGSFQRSSIDTVQHREEPRTYGLHGEGPRSGTSSFFERIAGPILMIAGTFLIVYLFFTVRN